MLIEFGDEMKLELNFIAQGLADDDRRVRNAGGHRDRALLRLDAHPLRPRPDRASTI